MNCYIDGRSIAGAVSTGYDNAKDLYCNAVVGGRFSFPANSIRRKLELPDSTAVDISDTASFAESSHSFSGSEEAHPSSYRTLEQVYSLMCPSAPSSARKAVGFHPHLLSSTSFPEVFPPLLSSTL